MQYRKTASDYVIDTIIHFILLFAGAVCVFPVIHILAVSLSSSGPASSGEVGLLPIGFSTDAYRYIASKIEFWRAFFVSIRRVGLGLIVNGVLTILCAYPLSKSSLRFPARKYYVAFFLVAMLFNGGLIPTYIAVAKTGVMGTIWALILPNAVPLFSMIVLLNFFRDLPGEIEEAAFIDGAGHWTILTGIYIPLSKAALATVTLFIIISHWNAWFDGLIYNNHPQGYPLQSYMQTVLVQADFSLLSLTEMELFANVSDRTVKAAQVFLGMIPVLAVYPFLQRYFTKGLVLGSVKG
ncbi:MAG: carbohydrate ABC transporter permease [Spirochaetaceae bacterium]|jgi:putative aldouronate transport system permease protein|nr:carbohydrate ABC transporter permease [Spirochaetaceae bacterium]